MVLYINPKNSLFELLAPAGSPEALAAALEAGADVVYMGAGGLNARRGAANANPAELIKAVEAAHARTPPARLHLALNVDLRQRDLGEAARWMACAAHAGVDALIVRDPAIAFIIAVWRQSGDAAALPEWHASTQASLINLADAQAAVRFGAARLVAARELSLPEIAHLSANSPTAIEVFIQGALCFSVSGRCLLSSWGGGHSGNRGVCASPCRARWSFCARHGGGTRDGNGSAEDHLDSPTPMSMRDLCALPHIPELAQAGIAAGKIEGRLKNAAWVHEAVRLYRRCLDGIVSARHPPGAPHDPSGPSGPSNPDISPETVKHLGAYAGRSMTAGYLTGERGNLTSLGSRPSMADSASPAPPEHPADARAHQALPSSGEIPPVLLSLQAGQTRATLAADWEAQSFYVEAPIVQNLKKGRIIKLEEIPAMCEAAVAHHPGIPVRVAVPPNPPDACVAARHAKRITDQFAAWARNLHKKRGLGSPPSPHGKGGAKREEWPSTVPAHVREWLRQRNSANPSIENRRTLGDPPSRIRFSIGDFGHAGHPDPDGCKQRAKDLQTAWVRGALGKQTPSSVVLEGALEANLPPSALNEWIDLWRPAATVIALPPVVFPPALPQLEHFISTAIGHGWTVEANSWGAAWLCQGRLPWEAGPGLAVLNSLAADAWHDWGALSVTYSVESDRRTLEEASACMSAPIDLIVFGRPALAVTRAAFPESSLEATWKDQRGMAIRPCRYPEPWGMTAFRPVSPFSWSGLQNQAIRARHIVADFCASPDPAAEWNAYFRNRHPPSGFRFNYDRRLR